MSNETIAVSLRISRQLLNRVDVVARKKGISRAELSRVALEAACTQAEAQEAQRELLKRTRRRLEGWVGPDGEMFAGRLKDGEPHGDEGVMTWPWPDGRRCEGEFQEGKPHGHATMHYPDGTVYRGGFRNGERYGHGKETRPDGSTIEGWWRGAAGCVKRTDGKEGKS